MPLVLDLGLVGCDIVASGDDLHPPGPQTLILEVRVEPNPVAVGDTATFTAVIEDSLDTSFEFRWIIDNTPTQYTDDNQLRWKAPAEAKIYTGVVTADNGDTDRRPAKGEFSIQVIE